MLESDAKRTKQICTRISPELYNEIEHIAKRQKWTMATTVNYILEQFIRDKQEIRL